MRKEDVAGVLEEIGTLLELKGENPFKCRAFHNAARIVGGLSADLETLIDTDQLEEIKGIGPGLAQNIVELVKSGSSAFHQELKRSLPPGLPEMLRIQGLGPKKIKALYERLKISSIPELKAAAERHSLASLDGFGEKTEANILRSIEQLEAHADKYHYPEAREAAERILERLREQHGVIRADVAGSLRRKKEIIGDIDVLVSARKNAAGSIMEAFTTHPDVETVLARGETKSTVKLRSGISCDLRVIAEAEYPFALAYFTGSKEHNVAMRSRANQYGWSLNEYGFSPAAKAAKRVNAKRALRCTTEEEIYRRLELPYIDPELREGFGELEAAEAGTLPKLIAEADLRGTFHCHTTYSDGTSTLTEMAEAARALGWEYLGIADHSKAAAYAGGLSAARVKQQQKEIDTLNTAMKPFRLFKGTEVDILPDGTLDWSEAVLASFDYVVASIHSKFTMTEREATKRIITAIKNKHVTMLGHPTGRLLLQREGYPVNMNDVISAAADYGTIIEINAHPFRLDLDWRYCKLAKERGVKISINPDAHTTRGLLDVRYGVGIARKGWLTARDVVNTRSVRDVAALLHNH